MAARCGEVSERGRQSVLATILMHKRDDPAATAEIDQLIAEVREIDADNAAELESDRKRMHGSHYSPTSHYNRRRRSRTYSIRRPSRIG